MARKGALLDQNNDGILTNPNLILPSDVGGFNEVFVDAVYPERIDHTIGGTVTFLELDPLGVFSSMTIRTRKVGARVFVDGFGITKSTISYTPKACLALISDYFGGEFMPDTPDYSTADGNIFYSGTAVESYKQRTLSVVLLRTPLLRPSLWLIGGVNASQQYNFSINYQTVD